MNDRQDHDNLRPKRPYQKPELVQVSLRPEEAVLGACKATTASGPASGTSTCAPLCRINGS